MTETFSRTDAAASVPSISSPRRLYLAAGWGGIAALAFWVLQPILVFLVVGDAVDQPTWAYFHEYRWEGLYEGLTFSGIAVGFFVLVSATDRLIERAPGETSIWWSAGRWLGVLAASLWLLVAGITIAPFTSVGYFVAELIPEVADQNAVYEAMGLIVTGVLMAFALVGVGWLVLFGVVARRRGVIGWPLSILAFVAAAAAVSPMLMPFSPPWGVIGVLGYALVLGIALLVKARKLPKAGRERAVAAGEA